MKISSKIILLTAALLGFLSVNAVISWYEINKINIEFNHVAKEDLALMQAASVLKDSQFKKEILFEKLASSAEELAFGNINESRRQYLLEYVKGLHGQFQEEDGKTQEQMKMTLSLMGSLPSFLEIFEHVHNSLNDYDEKVEMIFTAVLDKGYQLSMEDLDHLENQQVALSKDLQKALAEVWLRIEKSLQKIKNLQDSGRRVLWGSIILSLIFALILASGIIRRIHESLEILVKGARDLQQGKLGSHVQVQSTDEIGELANAFNRMSDQLKNYQEIMQRKNVELASNLVITREQTKELEKINRDLDRFVQLISHDINGPLSGILGYSSYLAQHAQGFDPKSVQIINHLKDSCHRLERMVKDLLEMSKITRQQRPFEKVDIGPLIQEAIQRQEFTIQKNSAEIHLPKDFPAVIGDRLKLSVVFFNLIGNAIKYSSKEGHQPQVVISWQKREKDFLFCVKDNGIGIDSKHYQDVFTMFKRLPEAEGFEGSGVGLAVVQEIIQEHGGQIWVESIQGSGSQFFFTIPLESPARFS